MVESRCDSASRNRYTRLLGQRAIARVIRRLQNLTIFVLSRFRTQPTTIHWRPGTGTHQFREHSLAAERFHAHVAQQDRAAHSISVEEGAGFVSGLVTE